ncbi:MAG: glutathione S-transferase family protein [Deltaproteobacteria bacterium]|nr:glutathione S-transferase family protein [Deltaproteobacteria bacterium]
MITLYQLKGCPFALRTRIALAEKQLPFETVFIDRANKPREVLEVSPSGTTPVIYDGEAKVRDSSIIAEYLEERYPQRPLLPADPIGRAAVRTALDDLDELVDAVGALFRATFKGGDLVEAKGEVREALDDWNTRLEKRAHVVGEQLTTADVNLYAHLATLEKLQEAPLPTDLPHLTAWYARMAERTAVASALKDAL